MSRFMRFDVDDEWRESKSAPVWLNADGIVGVRVDRGSIQSGDQCHHVMVLTSTRDFLIQRVRVLGDPDSWERAQEQAHLLMNRIEESR